MISRTSPYNRRQNHASAGSAGTARQPTTGNCGRTHPVNHRQDDQALKAQPQQAPGAVRAQLLPRRDVHHQLQPAKQRRKTQAHARNSSGQGARVAGWQIADMLLLVQATMPPLRAASSAAMPRCHPASNAEQQQAAPVWALARLPAHQGLWEGRGHGSGCRRAPSKDPKRNWCCSRSSGQGPSRLQTGGQVGRRLGGRRAGSKRMKRGRRRLQCE